jgi:translation initiation factor RLI1
MAKKNKIVLYKLLPFGNGFINPANIERGGTVWDPSTNKNPSELIFVGEINPDLVKQAPLPEGIIKVISASEMKKHFDELKNEQLKIYKRSLYKEQTDDLFIEAMREKILGNDTLWNEYLKKVEKIKSIKQVNE